MISEDSQARRRGPGRRGTGAAPRPPPPGDLGAEARAALGAGADLGLEVELAEGGPDPAAEGAALELVEDYRRLGAGAGGPGSRPAPSERMEAIQRLVTSRVRGMVGLRGRDDRLRSPCPASDRPASPGSSPAGARAGPTRPGSSATRHRSGPRPGDPAALRRRLRTSVGAITTCYLAATAHDPGRQADDLAALWGELSIEDVFRLPARHLLQIPPRLLGGLDGRMSLLRAEPRERLAPTAPPGPASAGTSPRATSTPSPSPPPASPTGWSPSSPSAGPGSRSPSTATRSSRCTRRPSAPATPWPRRRSPSCSRR